MPPGHRYVYGLEMADLRVMKNTRSRTMVLSERGAVQRTTSKSLISCAQHESHYIGREFEEEEEKKSDESGRQKLKTNFRNSWQQVKHANLYPDLV